MEPLQPNGTEPRLLLVAAWLVPFSLVPLVAAPDEPFLRAHAVHGTVTGLAAALALTAAALVPAWLGMLALVPLGTWLGTCCLRGMMAALAGRPPPVVLGVSAWADRHVLGR